MAQHPHRHTAKPLLIATLITVACSNASQSVTGPDYVIVNPASRVSATAINSEAIPAALGPDDRIVIRGGHFYTVGSANSTLRGRRVKLFGVSLALAANFPSAADGEVLAQRLAKLGVNIVRIHAIDQPAQTASDGPVGVLKDAAHVDLDPQAVRSLTRFIEQLGAHGIYTDLNLIANHNFPASRVGDLIPAQSKPLPIFDPDMTAWQEAYVKSLLAELKLKDSPNLALVEVNNESTLIDAWQDGSLSSLVTGRYRDELEQQWHAWCSSNQCAATPFPLERSGLSAQAASVAANFYLALDQWYMDRMIHAVRSILGDDIPISGTQIIHSGRWNHGGFTNFDVNRKASYTDAHFYIDHYFFPHRQWDWNDWQISNSWLGDNPELTLFNTAFARLAGRPFVISEFNQAWPNEQASDLLPIVTQFAVAQDWDGLILYDYAHDRKWNETTPSDFSLRGDSTKLVQFAQCAAYFRSNKVGTALNQTVIALSRDYRVASAASGISGNLAQYLRQHFHVPFALAARRQIAIEDGPSFSARDASQSPSSSWLTYDTKARQFIFGSAYAAGISGFLPQRRLIESAELGVMLPPGSAGFATAFLTSLDNKPLTSSTHYLLTLPGATFGTENGTPQRLSRVGWHGTWMSIASPIGKTPSASLYNVPGPVQMQRIQAAIRLKITPKRASVTALDLSGAPHFTVPARIDGPFLEFDVNTEQQRFAASYDIVVER
ncbi:hypothetical protein FHX57_005046 [Paraburkholderia tropica]|uniref:hypothetical protein n=1 Tax=Paraburkholderia tropica TaxID=92647 RepID=UPI00161410B7|nr:hypothetical protein [Paraburkholderia tropica]MBB3002673.1 hypothetical protein [Paraburkholderia tropica]MBB6321970.1 hypothetical protein [Paraburkholderia tropica]